MRRRRFLPATAATGLCAVVLTVGACSSHSSSSGSSTGTNGSTTGTAAAVQGISANVIKVGGLFESSDFAGAQAGFDARIDRANKDHELGKYTIKLAAMDDDGESPSTDLSNAENLVERQGVYAIAPIVTASFTSSTAAFLQQKKIPYFGAGFTDGFCQPYTYGLSQTGCAIGGSYVNGLAISQVAHAVGKPVNKLKWAFVGLDIPTGTQADDDYADTAKFQGGDVVYNKAVIPQNVGNLSPIISAVEATKPNVIWLIAGSQAIALKTAIKASGYTGAVIDSALYAPGLLQESAAAASALEGTYVEATMPVIEQGTPYVKQMESDYEAAGMTTTDITFGGEYAYMAADDMIALLKKIAPNFGDVGSALQNGFSYSPPSGGSPINYPFMYDAPTNCGSTVKVENGKYVTVTPYACSTSYIDIADSGAKPTQEPSPAG